MTTVSFLFSFHCCCHGTLKDILNILMFVSDFLPRSLANHQKANINLKSVCSANVFLQMHVWCHLVTSSTGAEAFKSRAGNLINGTQQLPYYSSCLVE